MPRHLKPSITALIHSFTLLELKNSHDFDFFSLEPEKSLPRMKEGSYDFFLETVEGKKIGIEILSRPSKGKLKQKLFHYAPSVDEFIFVLPSNSLQFYRKKPKTGLHNIAKAKYFPKQFNNKNLKVWLFDLEKKQFVKKRKFSNIFNVEK